MQKLNVLEVEEVEEVPQVMPHNPLVVEVGAQEPMVNVPFHLPQ